MPVILIDVNIEGHCAQVWKRMQSAKWLELTSDLDVQFRTFREVGIDPASPDDVVWRFCQAQGFYLLTSNRNEESDTSLEATLRREGTATSLPIFTIPFPDRVYHSSLFLDRVVERLLEYVLDQDNIAGAGRLYLP